MPVNASLNKRKITLKKIFKKRWTNKLRQWVVYLDCKKWFLHAYCQCSRLCSSMKHHAMQYHVVPEWVNYNIKPFDSALQLTCRAAIKNVHSSCRRRPHSKWRTYEIFIHYQVPLHHQSIPWNMKHLKNSKSDKFPQGNGPYTQIILPLWFDLAISYLRPDIWD